MMALPSLLKPPQAAGLPSTHHPKRIVARKFQSTGLINKPKRSSHTCGCFSTSHPNYFHVPNNNDFLQDLSEDHGIGDCLIFEEGAFSDPFLDQTATTSSDRITATAHDADNMNYKTRKLRPMRKSIRVEATDAENLIPDGWKDAVAEMNLSKKERRRIAREIEFNSRVEKKRQAYLPLKSLDLGDYQTFNDAKLAQLKATENFNRLSISEDDNCSKRVPPKDPRWAVYGKGIEDVRQLFHSQDENSPNKSKGSRKLFTLEEKALLNRKLPDLSASVSRKWHSLHAFAVSGEISLMSFLLGHNSDINAADADGLTALHKAIISKKHAMTRHLLKESANPFVLDKDGASLMHYAVQTASMSAIKLLLLYNVDINSQDKDGWTPLHVAIQARKTDVLKLLLIRGSDKTLKTSKGLTPLDLCLYSGRDSGTFEMIKLLKLLPKKPIVHSMNRSRKVLTS